MAERIPTLSNAAQLEIMSLVKSGMSMDEALKRATEMETKERASTTAPTRGAPAGLHGPGVVCLLIHPTYGALAAAPGEAAKTIVAMTGTSAAQTTLDAVSRMVQEGNISAADAVRHAEALNSVRKT